MWLALLLACNNADEPIVRAVAPPKPTPEAIAEKREKEELRTSPRNLEVNYVKPPGAYVDVQFLGGRRWDNVRDILVDQLGALTGQERDAQGDEVMKLERGTVTLSDGVIDVIDVPLPEPMRREDAMVACGFSGLADRYLPFTREYRVTQFQGFRRIVLHRVAPEDDLVNRLTGYKLQDRVRAP